MDWPWTESNGLSWVPTVRTQNSPVWVSGLAVFCPALHRYRQFKSSGLPSRLALILLASSVQSLALVSQHLRQRAWLGLLGCSGARKQWRVCAFACGRGQGEGASTELANNGWAGMDWALTCPDLCWACKLSAWTGDKDLQVLYPMPLQYRVEYVESARTRT